MSQRLQSTSQTTHVARVSADSATARLIVDAVFDDFDSGDAAASASEESDGRWSVLIHFRVPPNQSVVRALVALAAGAQAANTLAFETIVERDWVKVALDGLPPVAVGRFLVYGRHDRDSAPVNRIGIEIEAAMAFGTGHHGTTRGCLFALDLLGKRLRAKRVLDIGTGTGVLAIAAARAMHCPVVANDIDPRAVRIARDNARLNGVGAFVTAIQADGLGNLRPRRGTRYSLVMANILLQPLQRMALRIRLLAAPAGWIVLSGLLPHQANAALSAYRSQGFALHRRIAIDGWMTLVLFRGGRRRKRAGNVNEAAPASRVAAVHHQDRV